MTKSIYTYYKNRLIEIGGNNKCLCLRGIGRKNAYDLGRLLEGREKKTEDFYRFVFSGENELTLLSTKEKKELLDTLDRISFPDSERTRTPAEANRIFEGEIRRLREIARDADEIEKETGRPELFLGFPFVFGKIREGNSATTVKAPLLLIPIVFEFSDENTVRILRNEKEKIRINPALIFSVAQSKKLNIDALELEFDDLSSFGSVDAVVSYLASARVRLDYSPCRKVFTFNKFKEPEERDEVAVRFSAVLGRFPVSNAIYHDYSALEKKKLENEAIRALLSPAKARKPKPRKKPKHPAPSYMIKSPDFSQSEVVRKVGDLGNMVIYGPPGTGKSQTIVNIIADALCKHKHVLVVSQKKAALDVVYNRLGNLGEKAMYIIDESKQKQYFYDRALAAHQRDQIEALTDVAGLSRQYEELEQRIRQETDSLDAIYRVLNEKQPFGLSLSEMYNSSTMLAKNSSDYTVYQKMLKTPQLMALDYPALSAALFAIRAKDLGKLYYEFRRTKEKNPIVEQLREGLDLRTISEAETKVEELQKSRHPLFNTAKHPYYRQVLAYYYEFSSEENLDRAVALQTKFANPGKLFRTKQEEAVKEQFLATMDAIDEAARDYDFLHDVLTDDGYLAVIDNLLRGNVSYLHYVSDALENYISQRDIHTLLLSLDPEPMHILNFAYSLGKNYANYTEIIERLLGIRIFHEVLQCEERCKDDLAKLVDFPNISSRIRLLKEQQIALAAQLSAGKISREYDDLYTKAKNNKDYLYQISKKQKCWPIRKTMEVYSDFILALFPCWILSPENVSALLPLKKDLFDLVIFDEASQIFIESTIPTIYRGKNIVVAGDAKQLRPSATFMRRYLGIDPETVEDYSVQAALEVESLLDLSVSRYESANLAYHYRSRSEELIAFSNAAFYDTGLQIAPNLSKNLHTPPIERVKVKGRFVDRRNRAEALAVVEKLREILRDRRQNESIGIITFNAEQQDCIAEALEHASAKDPDFRSLILRETHRTEDGEDVSLFIKNLENVQGDERDIILFSVGYAPSDADGRVHANFGSLSAEGGENRLNVAVTRAKKRIILVTSIEPEDLKVEGTKNAGPKLLKKYLTYVRAVAEGRHDEVRTILAGLDPKEAKKERMTCLCDVAEDIAARLRKAGYQVELGLGNGRSRISLAVYDSDADRYLVGVVLDRDAFAASESCLERDVYQPAFLESRGWHILRVFCRDFWLSPTRVIRNIISAAEAAKKKKV